MVTLYGIPNCNTVKKARDWLTENDIEYRFHNFKKDQLEAETLKDWIGLLGWEVLLNKRGTTWRKLPEETRQDINPQKAEAIMLNNLSTIKRPVLNYDGQLMVGFKPEHYSNLFIKYNDD